MRCPFCRYTDTDVLDTRRLNDDAVIRRRRKCRQCNRRFTTYERTELSLTVVKKNGEREPYERDKLVRGVRTACYRRSVSVQQIEQLVNDVESVLTAHEGDEVTSAEVGDQVMRHLRQLDQVAYIRFASVYLSFDNIDKLREAVEELMHAEKSDRQPSAPPADHRKNT